jgi:[ribosomal protein S5]-alanine N-acetyltransferase
MSPSNFILTKRLLLETLSIQDALFVLELVNTDDWLTFIGDKNISTPEDAIVYIQKISANTTTNYWTVKLKDTQLPIGLVTVIKRDYLEHQDIGFAFLPNHFNKGYAYEATMEVLKHIAQQGIETYIVAITLPENISSIKLLQKLGLQFENEMEVEKELLYVYKMKLDVIDL